MIYSFFFGGGGLAEKNGRGQANEFSDASKLNLQVICNTTDGEDYEGNFKFIAKTLVIHEQPLRACRIGLWRLGPQDLLLDCPH